MKILVHCLCPSYVVGIRRTWDHKTCILHVDWPVPSSRVAGNLLRRSGQDIQAGLSGIVLLPKLLHSRTPSFLVSNLRSLLFGRLHKTTAEGRSRRPWVPCSGSCMGAWRKAHKSIPVKAEVYGLA